jgi:cytochrome c oxidase subunit IV
MAVRSISPMTYVTVCVILILLTVLTVSVSFIPLPGAGHTVVGLVIGLAKASLVVLFFMHALFSDRVTRIVIVISCFWVGLIFTLTLCDYFTRGLVPFMPGH